MKYIIALVFGEKIDSYYKGGIGKEAEFTTDINKSFKFSSSINAKNNIIHMRIHHTNCDFKLLAEYGKAK
jgi:hypothetical protein